VVLCSFADQHQQMNLISFGERELAIIGQIFGIDVIHPNGGQVQSIYIPGKIEVRKGYMRWRRGKSPQKSFFFVPIRERAIIQVNDSSCFSNGIATAVCTRGEGLGVRVHMRQCRVRARK
jgi:hypothetical protein